MEKTVRVENRAEIVANGQTPALQDLRARALDLFEQGLAAVDPARLVTEFVRREGAMLHVGDLALDLERYRRVHVIGGGKASGAMARALEAVLGGALTGGVVNVPAGRLVEAAGGDPDPGTPEPVSPGSRVWLHPADHPIPSAAGEAGTREILHVARAAGPDDLVFCVISGGGSALLVRPLEPGTLADLQALNDLLLASGASINEVNAVRKHVSGLKGGRLAEALAPATVVTLILSDVIGDPLDVIASGPTVPDPTTYADALAVLDKYALLGRVPGSIAGILRAGARGQRPETPKPDASVFQAVHNFVIGNARTAADAIVAHSRDAGWAAKIFSTAIRGEAREYASTLACLIQEERVQGQPSTGLQVLVGTGELTVTVQGQGQGGRNQEMLLALAPLVAGTACPLVVLSAGMDGIEGNSPAAGAVVDPHTSARGQAAGLDASALLAENDAHTYFARLGDAVCTGYTGTNVNDLTIVLLVRS